jgi:hypothetical protein
MTDSTAAAAATVTVEEYNKAVDRARSFEAKVTDFEKRYAGIDPDAYKATKEELEIARRESAAGDPEKIKELVTKAKQEAEAEAQKRYGSKLEEYEGLTKKQAADLKRLNVIVPSMGKAATLFTEDSLKYIEREIADNCDTHEGVVVAKGADGKPLPSKKDPRQFMGVDEFLEGFAASHPTFTKSNATGGTMKPGTTKGATSSGDITFEKYAAGQITREERAAMDPKVKAEFAKKVLSNVKIS